MTFTYDMTSPTDRERIRKAIGDRVSPAIFTDEEIAFELSERGSWQGAVVSLLEDKIAELGNTPNYTAQWLTVSVTTQIKTFTDLLDRKRDEYGLGGLRATTGYAWRPDSRQTAAPTFDSTEDN